MDMGNSWKACVDRAVLADVRAWSNAVISNSLALMNLPTSSSPLTKASSTGWECMVRASIIFRLLALGNMLEDACLTPRRPASREFDVGDIARQRASTFDLDMGIIKTIPAFRMKVELNCEYWRLDSPNPSFMSSATFSQRDDFHLHSTQFQFIQTTEIITCVSDENIARKSRACSSSTFSPQTSPRRFGPTLLSIPHAAPRYLRIRTAS
jgi:hypothetical protein